MNDYVKTKFNADDRLRYALVARPLLRVLLWTKAKMSYQNFAKAIGLQAVGEPWRPWFIQQVSEILDVVEFVDLRAHEETGIYQVVNADTGEPGKGAHKYHAAHEGHPGDPQERGDS